MSSSLLSFLFSISLAVVAGSAIAIQAPINARLAEGLGGTVAAAFVSFIVGMIALFVVLLMQWNTSSLKAIATVPKWTLIGGVFGAFFIFSSTLTVPRIGAAATVSAVIFGQLAAAVLIDRFGLFGLEAIEISPHRIVGILTIFAGVILASA